MRHARDVKDYAQYSYPRKEEEMKRTAKILALALFVVLALVCVCISVFAADVDTTFYTHGGFSVNGSAVAPSTTEGTTLADAIANATAGDVITLNNNIDLGSASLVPTVDVALDLNGKSVSTAGTFLTVNKAVTVNVNGGGEITCGQLIYANSGASKMSFIGEKGRITVNHTAFEMNTDTNNIIWNNYSGSLNLISTDVYLVGQVTEETLTGNLAYAAIVTKGDTLISDTKIISKYSDSMQSGTSYVLCNTNACTLTIENGSDIQCGKSGSCGLRANSTLVMRDSSLTSDKMAIRQDSSASVLIDNCRIEAGSSSALYPNSPYVTVKNSFLKSGGYSAYHEYNDVINSSDSYLKIEKSTIVSESTDSNTAAVYLSTGTVIRDKGASPDRTIDIDNCNVISTTNGIYIKDDAIINISECYVASKINGINLAYTSKGVYVDSSVINGGVDNSTSTGHGIYIGTGAMLCGNDNDIIKVTNSTVTSESFSTNSSVSSYAIYVNYSLVNSISGKITFDNCNISSAFRVINTGFNENHLKSENKCSININDSRLTLIHDLDLNNPYSETDEYEQFNAYNKIIKDEAQSFVRGSGTILNVSGSTKFIHSGINNNAFAGGSQPAKGAITLAEGVRFNYDPVNGSELTSDENPLVEDEYSIIYDPFGDAECPYVVTKSGSSATGFTGITYLELGTTNLKLNDTLVDNVVNMHIGSNSKNSAVPGCFTLREANNNTFIKYTLPQASYDGGNFDVENNTFEFTGSGDWITIGGGSVKTACINPEYGAKKVIVMEMDFTAGSDAGYVYTSVQIGASGDSDKEGATAGDADNASSFMSINPGADGKNAAVNVSGNGTYTLRGNHEWNKLQVVVDVVSNKAHVFVNGTQVSASGDITAFSNTAKDAVADYIQGIRFNIQKEKLNSADAALSFDNFNWRIYDDYAGENDSFVLNDYVSNDKTYLTLPVTSEAIVAGGKAYSSVNSALDAVRGTDYTVRLHGDVTASQSVENAGKLLTFGNKLTLRTDNFGAFFNYTKTNSGFAGEIYTFAYNTSLGTQMNLSLHSSFDINFYIPKAISGFVTRITADGTDITADAFEFTNSLNETYLVSTLGRVSCAAADVVKLAVTFTENGKTYTYTYSLSIEKYVDKITANFDAENATDEQRLMYYIMSYSNEADKFFNSDASLDAKVESLAGLKDTALQNAVTDITNTINTDIFYGATIQLDETPSVRLVLNEATDKTITATYVDVRNGNTVTVRGQVKGKCVDFNGIKIYNLAQTLTVYVGGEEAGQFNIGAYVENVKASESYYALVCALCDYITYAKASFSE